jgi:hypothetical protein
MHRSVALRPTMTRCPDERGRHVQGSPFKCMVARIPRGPEVVDTRFGVYAPLTERLGVGDSGAGLEGRISLLLGCPSNSLSLRKRPISSRLLAGNVTAFSVAFTPAENR